MNSKNILLFLFCLFCFEIYAQNKFHEFSLGIGQEKIKNSFSIPSGMAGVDYSVDYVFQKPLKNKGFIFGYLANLDYSKLNYNKTDDYSSKDFHTSDVQFAAFWLANIPLNINNFNLFSGLGISLQGSIIFSTQRIYSIRTDAENGYWHLSPDWFISGNYKFGKFFFQSDISVPLLFVGYFSHSAFPEGSVSAGVKHILTPNTFCFFTERVYPKADISVSYPLFSNNKTESRVQLTYAHEQLVYNGFPYERKMSNGLKLGMVWVVK